MFYFDKFFHTSFADSHDMNITMKIGITALTPDMMTNLRIPILFQLNFLTIIPPDNKPMHTVGGIAKPV